MAKQSNTDGEPDCYPCGKKHGGLVHKEMPFMAKHGHQPITKTTKHGHKPMRLTKKKGA